LNGNLWVDTETGVLLKSEIMVYEGQTGRVLQEHRLEISEIETVSPFAVPEPVVDPAAIVAATATAQVWTTLETTMNYRGTPLTFEFIPLEVRQVPDSSPLRAEVRVMIRKLPAYVLSEENIEPFLAQLRQQVTLSIPNRNLIVTSSGYELENQTQEPGVLRMSFDFNANLEDFNRIELILAGQGNPQFVPVPVK
jgi:hypothetical protein